MLGWHAVGSRGVSISHLGTCEWSDGGGGGGVGEGVCAANVIHARPFFIIGLVSMPRETGGGIINYWVITARQMTASLAGPPETGVGYCVCLLKQRKNIHTHTQTSNTNLYTIRHRLTTQLNTKTPYFWVNRNVFNCFLKDM